MNLPIVICVLVYVTVQVSAQQPCPAVSAAGTEVFTTVAPDFCCYAADTNCNSDNDCTYANTLSLGGSTPTWFTCHSGTCIYVVDDVCDVQFSGGAAPCSYDAQVESYCMADLILLERAESSGSGDTPSAPTPASNTSACIVPGKSNYALSDVAPGSCCYVTYSTCEMSTQAECANGVKEFSTLVKYDCDTSNGTCYYIADNQCDPDNFDTCTYSSNLTDNCHILYIEKAGGPVQAPAGAAPAASPSAASAPTSVSTSPIPAASPTPEASASPSLSASPVPASPSSTASPSTASAPTSVPASVPASPTPATSPASASPSGGGTSCIASHQTVTVRKSSVNNSYTTKLRNLKAGDEILTDKGYKRYIGSIHAGKNDVTIAIHVDDGTSVELTRDHLIKTKNGFVHAKNIKVGDVLEVFANDVTGYKNVIETKNSTSHVVSPLTSSGTIVVNDVIVSCYAVVKYHQLANFIYIPVRLGIVESEYFTLKVTKAYNVLPMWFKLYSNIATLNFVYP